MFHGPLNFGTYWASLFLYMIKFLYQICVESLSVINLQWWRWSKKHYETWWANTKVRAYKCTSSLIDNSIYISPLFPNQGGNNAIQNKWCSGNETNNQQNQKYAARKSQEALWPYRTKRKPPIWNDIHANFLARDWKGNRNGIIVIQGKEVVDWLVN